MEAPGLSALSPDSRNLTALAPSSAQDLTNARMASGPEPCCSTDPDLSSVLLGGSRSMEEAIRRGPGMPPESMHALSTTSTLLDKAPPEYALVKPWSSNIRALRAVLSTRSSTGNDM